MESDTLKFSRVKVSGTQQNSIEYVRQKFSFSSILRLGMPTKKEILSFPNLFLEFLNGKKIVSYVENKNRRGFGISMLFLLSKPTTDILRAFIK